jgi:hypothetical protein
MTKNHLKSLSLHQIRESQPPPHLQARKERTEERPQLPAFTTPHASRISNLDSAALLHFLATVVRPQRQCYLTRGRAPWKWRR